MFGLSKFRRLVRAGVSLITQHAESNVTVPVVHKVSRQLHSSNIKMQEYDDSQAKEQADFDAEDFVDSDRTYWNSVSMIGDVAAEPFPVHRSGELFGYRLKIQTQRKIRGFGTVPLRTFSNTFDAVCNLSRLFSLVENIRVNDQVLLRGRLVNFTNPDSDVKVYKTVIAIQSIIILKTM